MYHNIALLRLPSVHQTHRRKCNENFPVEYIPPRNHLSLKLGALKKSPASENSLTFTGEWTKVTAGHERLFNFTLLLYGDTSNDGGPPRETQSPSR